jgi:hypothetical protein
LCDRAQHRDPRQDLDEAEADDHRLLPKKR